jgi:hypothetical protein
MIIEDMGEDVYPWFVKCENCNWNERAWTKESAISYYQRHIFGGDDSIEGCKNIMIRISCSYCYSIIKLYDEDKDRAKYCCFCGKLFIENNNPVQVENNVLTGINYFKESCKNSDMSFNFIFVSNFIRKAGFQTAACWIDYNEKLYLKGIKNGFVSS